MNILIIIIALIIILYFYFRITKSLSIKHTDINEQNDSHNPRIRKSKKTWGKFIVKGYHHLPEDVKKMVWKELKVGDELKLVPDPTNQYDKTAIKVMFQDKQIGWFPKDHDRKIEVFNVLKYGRDIKVTCTMNDRRQDYIDAYKPDKDGNYNDKYLGMTQFVEGKFEYKT
jgi:hypothetical protein